MPVGKQQLQSWTALIARLSRQGYLKPSDDGRFPLDITDTLIVAEHIGAAEGIDYYLVSGASEGGRRAIKPLRYETLMVEQGRMIRLLTAWHDVQ